MNIAKLFLERFLMVNIEVVVALLPEVRSVSDESAGDTLLQRLDGNGQRFGIHAHGLQDHRRTEGMFGQICAGQGGVLLVERLGGPESLLNDACFLSRI